MNKWLFLYFIIFGCSERVVHFVSPKIDLSQYHSFGITNLKLNRQAPTADVAPLFNTIELSINTEMKRRGYIKNVLSPDLIVRYELIALQQTQLINNQNNYSPAIVNNYRTSEEYGLLLELIDPASSKTLWQASVDLKKFDVKNREQTITTAVTRLFNTYQYKAGSNDLYPELDLSNKK